MARDGLDLDTGQLSALVANFYAADAEVQREAKRIVARAGDAMYAIADVLCARRTGFMASQLTVRLTEGGYGVAVGWYAEDFLSAGLSFYPPYVELGTSRMSAQPAIGPAFDVVAPQFELELAELVTAAIARQIARAAAV